MRADTALDLTASPEEALLIRTAGGRCAVPTDGGELDWERLLAMARWHRLGPLLWDHLRQAGPELAVPHEVLAAFRDDARKATARSVNLQHELDRLLALLESSGVPALLLKGAALVEAGAYPDRGLRVMVDLDVLVPADELVRVHSLVAETLGYTVRGMRVSPDDAARWHHHYQLVRGNGSIIIELHRRMFPDRPDEDIQGVWDRAVPGGRTPAHLLPSPEDLALHVAVHFGTDRVKQRDSALGQLADLVRIAERWTIDWDAVVERAAAARLSDRLFLALYSAQVLFGEVVPDELVASLRPASFTPELGIAFVRRRVLAEGPMLPIDQVQVGGLRRLFPGRGALERYVRYDEPTPSITRLRARRWAALTRRLATQLPRPLELARDVRLSRWMTTLLGE
jgi:hypothetical protein